MKIPKQIQKMQGYNSKPIDPRDTTDIPAAVRRAAQDHCRKESCYVRYYGMTRERTEVYTLVSPTAGFPTLYLWDGYRIAEVSGVGALHILNKTRQEERKPRPTASNDIVLKPEKQIPGLVLEAAYTGWLVQYIGRTADGEAVYRAFPDGPDELPSMMALGWNQGRLQEYWGERAVGEVLDKVVDRKEIPAAVLAEHERHKGSLDWPLEYLGLGADEAEVYILKTPIGSDTGLPICYTWKEDRVTYMYGDESLDYLQTVKRKD